MIAKEGDSKAAVVEVNSETDFVAKNGDFQAYVAAVAVQALASDAADIDAFMAEAWNQDTSKNPSCLRRSSHAVLLPLLL